MKYNNKLSTILKINLANILILFLIPGKGQSGQPCCTMITKMAKSGIFNHTERLNHLTNLQKINSVNGG